MKQYDIYAIGNALVDTEIEVSDADLERFGIQKGFMTLVDEARQNELTDLLQDHLVASRRASGGSACNTVIAASYFGAKTFYSCKLAEDDNGRFYLNDLERAGVDYLPAFAEHPGTSGKCLVLITPDAERTMNTFLGISATVGAEQLHAPAISQAKIIYIEGYLAASDSATEAVCQLKQQGQANGAQIALTFSDPSMVNYCQDNLRTMIGDGVDLLFCNETEALDFTGKSTLAEAVEALKPLCKKFALTLGAKGALVYDGEQSYQIAAHAVQPIDSNGAGDLFAGAFLYAISHGHTFPEAGALASLASATLVTQFGPRLDPTQYEAIRQQVLGA
ncbi:adenosine kinase [Halioxenophilus sp. WMMB6]|uniref:adenosine kinase n=1 Tax=Halioxenophilus sp. WMMB6 TaxID=3073815 RepID=UPI00295E25C4|nr:adenosine kinase [Halioxenophilus sp. WMMB6]